LKQGSRYTGIKKLYDNDIRTRERAQLSWPSLFGTSFAPSYSKKKMSGKILVVATAVFATWYDG
jgi:hypothetical protein